jgi:hypothetical protein
MGTQTGARALDGRRLDPSVEPPEDFHSTLRKFSNTMVVEDIEVVGEGTVRFHGRGVEMPQRPKFR